ncbi:MAG: site-2 protease family protein [Clostridia bacterium]|nr:site-2 protease family protein [Clostridia bacterium]
MLTNIFSSVWTILVTVFIFGILITIHELGHYLVARAFKVGIREFSVGMGPPYTPGNARLIKFPYAGCL